MSEPKSVESIIAADIGSTFTHVCLIDIVEGVYRLVARAESPSTVGEPENDLTIGLRRAIARLEQASQRLLLDQDGELIIPEQETLSGVDLFVATSNAAPPLQCVIIGLTDDLSVESAQRVCAAANVAVVQTISLGMRLRRWDDRMLISLRQTPPDLILLVGGVDTGPIAPVESAARVLATIYEDIRAERRPTVIFAGNQEARRPVSAIMSSLFDFHVVDNVRPNAYAESPGELQRELIQVYENIKLAALPGYRRLRRWCKVPILSTARAWGNTLCYLAFASGGPCNVVGVDIGGASTHAGMAWGVSSPSGGGLYRWAISADLGCSYGLDRVLALSGPEDIVRWLPMPVSVEDAVSYLENVRLRPHSIPQTMEDVFLAHAVVRQALLLTMSVLRGQHEPGAGAAEGGVACDLIAARGGPLIYAFHDGLVALTLLDALQPVGLACLVLDRASIWPQVGAIASIAPLAATQVLQRDGLYELGTVLAPDGLARDGEQALRIRITYNSGQVIDAAIQVGTIQCFPLGTGEYATLEVISGRLSVAMGFDKSKGRQRPAGRARVRGGSLGLIVDARGRPLNLPQDPELCRTRLQQWLGNLIPGYSESIAEHHGALGHV